MVSIFWIFPMQLPWVSCYGMILYWKKKPCYAYVCLKEEAAYGQVILNDGSKLAIQEGFGGHNPNVEVCTKIDTDLFKKRLLSLLMNL